MVLTNFGSKSETCVGCCVRLVGAFIYFKKNFYRLPFTPPLSGSPFRSFTAPQGGAHGYKHPPCTKQAICLSNKTDRPVSKSVRPVFKPTSRWTVLVPKPVRPVCQTGQTCLGQRARLRFDLTSYSLLGSLEHFFDVCYPTNYSSLLIVWRT
jgi:hypothetical protein